MTRSLTTVQLQEYFLLNLLLTFIQVFIELFKIPTIRLRNTKNMQSITRIIPLPSYRLNSWHDKFFYYPIETTIIFHSSILPFCWWSCAAPMRQLSLMITTLSGFVNKFAHLLSKCRWKTDELQHLKAVWKGNLPYQNELWIFSNGWFSSIFTETSFVCM